jgi:hypothetical protein
MNVPKIPEPDETDLNLEYQMAWWLNEMRRRDILGCYCKTTAEGGYVTDHLEGRCDCWCAPCADHNEAVAAAREQERDIDRYRAYLREEEEERARINAQARQRYWEMYESPEALERQAQRKAAEAAEAAEREAEDERIRERNRREGPPYGVRWPGDGPSAVRALAAYRSVLPDMPDYYGILVVAQGKLCELRSDENCDDDSHRKYRNLFPGSTDPTCDAWCGATFHLRPVTSWRMLKDYLGGSVDGRAYQLSDDGLRWLPIEVQDEWLRQALAADKWPGVAVLIGVASLPFTRLDGSVVTEPGFDVDSGWWATQPMTPSPPQLPGEQPTLADRLEALVGWRGSMSELALALDWNGTPEALVAELRRLAADLMARRAVTVTKTGGRCGGSRRTEWAIRSEINPLNPPHPPALP